LTARSAIIGMVVVLAIVAGVVGASSLYTSQVTDEVVSSEKLSADYELAAKAVANEESLERKYRLEPGPDVLARYDAAATQLIDALHLVSVDGDSVDRAGAEEVIAAHQPYLSAIKRMFLAVDRGDAATVLTIDGTEVDPRFASIETSVNDAAEAHRARSLRALDSLRRFTRFTTLVTPLVFVVGLGFVAVFASVLRRVRRQLENQRQREVHDSLHDSLTGLPNRASLNDSIGLALRGLPGGNSVAGLLVIDLDRFQQINNTLGRQVGDGLLAQIGPRLSSVLGAGSAVFRLGGDQFAVLLDSIDDADRAVVVAERLNFALVVPFSVEGVDLAIEASIGVAVSDAAEDELSFVQRAEIAMYVAKAEGTGIVSYRPEHDVYSPERLELFGELRRALTGTEFVLYYQPKIVPRTGEMCGVEALARWNNPKRGLVHPDEFIPLVEHTALVAAFTRRIVEIAVSQIRSWLDIGLRIPIAVNLSARNLLDPDLVQDVVAVLDRFRVPAELLSLEVTESALITEPARATATLRHLHQLGIHIAIDDFGAGYTSLQQLRTLPITDLKIDGSFVTTMDTDPSNALIVNHIIKLGHDLGLTIVAEGVENQAVLDLLADSGCDQVQGFHLSRPLHPLDIQTFRQTAGLSLAEHGDATVGVPVDRV
jgi:diguanylate cyclase